MLTKDQKHREDQKIPPSGEKHILSLSVLSELFAKSPYGYLHCTHLCSDLHFLKPAYMREAG